jgi:hypothetical protein
VDSANVSFIAPTGTGVITSYIPSSGSVTGTASPLKVSGLITNTSYPSFTLKAANATGNSVDSSPAITLLTLPGPPTALAYVASSATTNQVTITFTAPSGNGTITSYVPKYGSVTGTASPLVVSSLTVNTPYSFTMKSTNSSGSSVDSSPALSILTLPDPPTALTYSATNLSNNSFSIAFTAPTTGTGTIIGYVPSSGGGTGTTSPFTVTGLTSNTSYTITLRATNASGNSAASATSVTKLTLPDAPTIGTATIVNSTSVSVSFTASSGTGLTYTVTSSPGSFTGIGTSSPITVTNTFLSSTSYKFSVVATNNSGSSTASGLTATGVTPNSITYYSGLVWTVYYDYFGAGSYYNGSNLTIAPINQVWGVNNNTAITKNPGVSTNMTNLLTATSNIVNNGDITGISRHRFSVEWVGYFKPNETGTWTFTTASDDASYLWIDNDSTSYATSGYNALTGTSLTATVYNGYDQGVTERSGTAALTSGRYYFIRIQFGENGGGYDMRVTHKAPSASTASYDFTSYAYNTVRAN